MLSVTFNFAQFSFSLARAVQLDITFLPYHHRICFARLVVSLTNAKVCFVCIRSAEPVRPPVKTAAVHLPNPRQNKDKHS